MAKCQVKPFTNVSLKNDTPLGKAQEYVNKHYENLRKAAGLLSDNSHQFLKLREYLDTALHGAVSASIDRIESGSWLENWFATTFSWRRKLLSDELSGAGELNERIMRTTNAAVNVFKNFVANEAVPIAKRNYDTLRTMLPDAPRRELENIIHDAAIIASTEEIAESVGAGGRKYLDKRASEFVQRLGELGLNQAQISQVIDQAKEYADIYRIGQAYLLDVGLEFDRLPGYVPIVFDKGIQDVVTKKIPSFSDVVSSSLLDSSAGIKGSNASSRRTTFIDYVIEDMALLKEKLGKVMPDITNEKLLEWAEDANAFKQDIISKLTDTAVEQLLEEGIISRIPSMHKDIVETLVRKEGLPLGLAEDVFLTDPVKALKQWAESLEKITAESFALKDLLTNGIAQGYVVGKEVADQHVGHFVKLSDLPLLDRFSSPHLKKAVGDQYIHVVAAQQLNAVLRLNSEPIQASYLGKALDLFGRYTSYFGKSLLGNPVSAISQITQNAVQVMAAVGNISHLPSGFHDAFKLSTKGFDGFSDTVMFKFGNEVISEKDLVRRMVLTRGGVNIADIASPGGLKVTMGDIKRIFDYDINQVVRKGLIKFKSNPLGSVTDALGGVSDVLFKQTAMANFFSDVAARMAILRTLNENPSAATGFAGIINSKIDSVESALRYTDEYIGFFDGNSELASLTGRYIRPFFSYLMSAPGQGIRHAMRHPKRFSKALSLYHHYAVTEGRRNYGYDKESWNRSRMLIPLWQNPVTRERVLFAPGAVDNTLNTIEFFDGLFSIATRLTGGNTRDKVADLEARANPAKTVSDFIGSFWAGNYYDSIRNALAGKNSFSGGDPNPIDSVKIATWFGIPMSPHMRAILQMSFPWSNQMERMLPAEVVGKRAVKNALGNDLEPPVPSIFGAVPESGGARGNFATNLGLGLLGIRPVYSDTILNLTRTQNDLDRIRADAIAVQRYLINKKRMDSEEFRKATQVVREIDLIKIDVNNVAAQEGVDPPEAIRILKQRLGRPANELLRLINSQPQQ